LQTLIIKNKFPSLNEYITAERTNRHMAAKIKKDLTYLVYAECKRQKIKKADRVKLHYIWYEVNKKRDMDNVAFNQKFIQDGLVNAGILRNDGWDNITGFTHEFELSKEHGVVIKIEEVAR